MKPIDLDFLNGRIKDIEFSIKFTGLDDLHFLRIKERELYHFKKMLKYANKFNKHYYLV